MARNREFDTTEVLDKAMALFWRKGFANTSIQDLVDHLRLGKGSLYNAFASKRALFLASLDRYAARSIHKFQRLLKDNPPKDAFRMLFESTIQDIMGDREHRGCFLINATTEMAADDVDVAERIKRNHRQQIDVFEKALDSAKQRGELSVDMDTLGGALFFSNTLKGLRVMAKMNPSLKELKSVADVALKIFDWPN